MAKRLLDLAVASLGLILLSPLFLVIAVLIKLDSSGPVVYRGLRVGKDGRVFRIFKFRTMVADAAKRGPGVTVGDDLRITRMGRFLRKMKLDELPQLINVLQGAMSLVGPRPEDPAYVARYSPDQLKTLSTRPGITGAASLRYRHEEALIAAEEWEKTYLEVVLPRKLEIELEYVERRTFLADVALIGRTLFALFR